MHIPLETVRHVAALARLELPEASLERYAGQLERILEHMDALRTLPEVPVSPSPAPGAPADTSPTAPREARLGARLMPMRQPLREDRPETPAPPLLALANAPDREDSLFRVPRILES